MQHGRTVRISFRRVWAKKPRPAKEPFGPIVEALARSVPKLKSVDLDALLDARFVQHAEQHFGAAG